jgi:polysaccharide export outer membrane protein
MLSKNHRSHWFLIAALVTTPFAGCLSPAIRHHPAPPGAHGVLPVARELEMVTYPEYRVGPPDILLIDAVRVIPKQPYKIQELDILQVFVAGGSPTDQIGGVVQVQPDGSVSLGPQWGAVKVAGMTFEEAAREVTRHLQTIQRTPFDTTVSLAQSTVTQPIIGEHVIGPDGTVNLGTYGSVHVAGMTMNEVKAAVEQHLSNYLDRPIVSVDILAYNSKVYYIIREGGTPATGGDQVVKVPATGNETVLDALAQIQGLTQMQSKNVWVARPTPDGVGCDQILPVDYKEVTQNASSSTNYQILPGDRVYVAEDKTRAFDAFIERVTGPVERIFGFTLLGSQTAQTINRFPRGLLTQQPNF